MPISTTFNGYPLLLLPPDLDKGATSRSATVATDDFEGDAGDMIAMRAAGLPNTTEQIAYLCRSRAELEDLEDFVRSLDGMAQSFWVPTWNDDITVLVPGAGPFVIRDIGYTEFFYPTIALRTLFVVNQTDYTDWAVKSVASSTDNGDGTETLTGGFAPGTPGSFNTATSGTHRFMFLRFVRLASDDVKIEYLSAEHALVTLEIVNVPASNPQFNVPVGYTPIQLTNVASPYDSSMYIASVRGGVPGDWFTNAVADPGPLPTCAGPPDITVSCAIINTEEPARIWRTEPLDAETSFTIMRVTALAGNGGGTYDRYSRLHLKFTIRQMRDDVAIQSWSTNYAATDWSGGGIGPSTSAISLVLVGGDYFQIELDGQAGLHQGYADAGNRPFIVHGYPYIAYLFVYGVIRPLVP